MNAKEYLSRYKLIDGKINGKLEQITRLKEIAHSTTMSYSGERNKSKTHDKIGNLIAKIVDLEVELQDDVDDLIDIQKETRDLIGSMDEEKMKYIFEMRYINLWTWEKIAESLNNDKRSIFRLQKKGLEEIEFLLSNIYESNENDKGNLTTYEKNH